MSLVTPDQVRALVETDLDDTQLQEVIDREESMLATRIGPLTGERSVTFYPSAIPPTTGYGLPLGRHVSDVADIAITDALQAVDADQVRLDHDGWGISRPGYLWVGPVVITYTPDDEDSVVAAIIDLVGLRLSTGGSRTGLASENIGGYGYSLGSAGGASAAARTRRRIIASLLRPLGPTSIRLRGASRLDATLPRA
jgi:hypothetical protein